MIKIFSLVSLQENIDRKYNFNLFDGGRLMFKRSMLSLLLVTAVVCPVVYADDATPEVGGFIIENVVKPSGDVKKLVDTDAINTVSSFFKALFCSEVYTNAFEAVQENGLKEVMNHKTAVVGVTAAAALAVGGCYWAFNALCGEKKADEE